MKILLKALLVVVMFVGGVWTCSLYSQGYFANDTDYNVRGIVVFMEHDSYVDSAGPGGWAAVRTAKGFKFHIRTDREEYYNRVSVGDSIDLSTMKNTKLRGWWLGKYREGHG